MTQAGPLTMKNNDQGSRAKTARGVRAPKTSPAPRLLSIATVALQLDVSQKTVRRLIEDGELPIHRIGRQVRISESDLAAFIARSRCAS
jgi:excisionase family DNA binding protein